MSLIKLQVFSINFEINQNSNNVNDFDLGGRLRPSWTPQDPSGGQKVSQSNENQASLGTTKIN